MNGKDLRLSKRPQRGDQGHGQDQEREGQADAVEEGDRSELPHEDSVDGDAQEERGDSRGGRRFLDEQSEEERRQDPRGNESLEFLNIIEDALEFGIAELGGDQADDKNEGDRRPPADLDQGFAARVLPDVALVYVHGEERRHRVEEGTQRADHRPGDRGQDETAEAGADQIPDEEGISLVGRRARRRKPVSEELPGDDSRDDDDEGDNQLQEGGEQDADLALPQAPGGQSALGDELG